MRNRKVKYWIIVGISLILFTIGMLTVATTGITYASQLSEIRVEDSTNKEIVIDVQAIEEVIIEEPIEEETVKPYDEETIEVLTNTLYGEARGVKGDHKKAAVIWCILNRYDNGKYGKTIIDVATAPNQFCGYVKGRVYKDINSYNHCREIVIDVLDRYYTEEQVGRTLPKDYLYFVAKNGDNVFTKKWKSNEYWNWSLESPYNN